MAGNKTLELSIKIAGKVDKSLINAINAAQNNVSSLSTTLSKVGTVGLATMGAMATGTVAALAKCTDAAKDFESQMGDVVKYVDGLADADGLISDKIAGNGATYAANYAEMSKAILDLSTEIPYTAEELTRLAAAAGQSGKGISDLIQHADDGSITGFLKDVAMLGTAWDISADQAGDWAAKWEVAFSKNHEEIMTLADQINYLGAHNATTAAEIAQVVNEAAGLGQVAGMDVDATAALGTAMLAMGVDTAKAANSINRMYTNMSKGASATKAQKEMWQELGFTATGIAASMQSDASGTLLSVFEAIQQLPDERQVAALSTLFGQWAITGAAKLTGNLDTFRQALSDIDNEALFNGSMEREFVIKANTSEAIDTMMASTFKAFQIDIGTAFLPAKKEISVALIDFMNQLRNMPELGAVAQQLAALFSQGVTWAKDALKEAMPTIQKALDYLVNNGPQVLSFLGKLAAAFAAMKFAPGIESLVRGAGSLVFGSATGGSTHTGSGGVVGLMGNLFRGGQNVIGGAAAAIPSLISTAGGILGTARIDAQLNGRNLLGTLLGQTQLGGGLANYFGGIKSSLGNFLNVSGVADVTRGTLGVGKEILTGIAQATGLTDLVNSAKQKIARVGAAAIIQGNVLAQNIANSAPVQAISGFAGRMVNSTPVQGIASMASGAAGWLGNVIPAGADALGGIWGPMVSGFGGLLSGALPIVGAISGIIAVVSIFGDHLDDIRGIIQNVFGDAGVVVFDSFIGVLGKVGDFITGLFADGGVAAAMAPIRDAITGIFGDDAGAAFDGLVQILQSVMGVIGQVVAFANTTVKPIIQEIFGFTQTIVPIILQTFTAAAPTISSIISNLGSAVMICMQVIGTAIQAALPIIEGVISAVLSIASVVIPALLAGYEVFSSGLETIVSAVQTVFQGIIDFVTGVFTGNWQQAWQAVQDIFGGIFEGLGAMVKTPLNAVIAIINKAISGINGLGLTIPDWVPIIGGNSFSINIPEIPMLAKGGFTNGPSIAGEAGTEAVISFQQSARASNIATWAKAGQMLGVSNNQPMYRDSFIGGQSTAAIINFQNSTRTNDIAALTKTGPMLGASSRPVRLETFDTDSGGSGNWGGGEMKFTYAPTIIIQGNADRDMVDSALRDSEARAEAQFNAWYEKKRREERRARW